MPVAPIGNSELHLHLEGSLSVESCVDIARLRGEAHPWRGLSPAQLRRSFAFRDFGHFLSTIRDMCRLLASLDALERAAGELSLFLSRHGIEYAEVYCSPYIYVRWGLDFGDVLRALDSGFQEGEESGGATCRILIDTVRQWGPHAAHVVLDGVEQNLVPRVVGFGVGGEQTLELSEFRSAFDRARALGLRTVTHAGEGTGADEIWQAIDVLGVDRIAHGIRAIHDPLLLRTLADRRVPLDVAVTSNYRTRVVTGVPHPMRVLIDHGIIVTLSTDDPSLFRTDLPREYVRARRFAGLSEGELQQIARNAVEASFATEEEKRRLRSSLEERELQLKTAEM